MWLSLVSLHSCTHKESDGLSDVTEEESDVDKHENITQQDCVHICLALPSQLIFNRALENRDKVSEGKAPGVPCQAEPDHSSVFGSLSEVTH